VGIDIRHPAEQELREAMQAASVAFGSSLEDEEWQRESVTLPADRALVAFDDGRAVGLAGAYPFELTVPGAQLPCSGVTWVGVMPTHRRRGILRGFMEQQFADAREWGEPVAALWASEASIYGRFGYGPAAPGTRMKGQRDRFSFHDDPGPVGTWRLVDADEAFRLFPPVYERLRLERPAMLSRTEHWWRAHKLADPESWRRGNSQKFYASFELDGEVAAYSIYRVKEEWEDGFPKGIVRPLESFATAPASERELWRYLFGIDLMSTVEVHAIDPASPLFLMVRDPRALRLSRLDALWLRLVDVDASLRSRTYRDGEPVVLEVSDELCPWNAGRYRVGAEVGRTDDAPDLQLDVADLATVYLGGFSFLDLARAERVRELVPGALERATELFRTPLPPYCPEVF
jgi:predicted acetyltransferase